MIDASGIRTRAQYEIDPIFTAGVCTTACTGIAMIISPQPSLRPVTASVLCLRFTAVPHGEGVGLLNVTDTGQFARDDPGNSVALYRSISRQRGACELRVHRWLDLVHDLSHFVRGPDRGHDDLRCRQNGNPAEYRDHFLTFFDFIQSANSLPTMKSFWPFLLAGSPWRIQPLIVLRLDPTAPASWSRV